MLQHLAHIRPSTFQLDWYVNIHLIALLCIGDSQPTCVAVYIHELFSLEEMMGVKGNEQSIQNRT